MLQMACGTAAMAVSRKHQVQTVVDFNMPLVLVGNSFPDHWPNEAGQTERRMFIAYWDRPVPAGDVNQQLPVMSK